MSQCTAASFRGHMSLNSPSGTHSSPNDLPKYSAVYRSGTRDNMLFESFVYLVVLVRDVCMHVPSHNSGCPNVLLAGDVPDQNNARQLKNGLAYVFLLTCGGIACGAGLWRRQRHDMV